MIQNKKPSELQRLVYRVAEMPGYYQTLYMLYFRDLDVEDAVVELGKLMQCQSVLADYLAVSSAPLIYSSCIHCGSADEHLKDCEYFVARRNAEKIVEKTKDIDSTKKSRKWRLPV